MNENDEYIIADVYVSGDWFDNREWCRQTSHDEFRVYHRGMWVASFPTREHAQKYIDTL
jgi:hypothetical protein